MTNVIPFRRPPQAPVYLYRFVFEHPGEPEDRPKREVHDVWAPSYRVAAERARGRVPAEFVMVRVPA